MTCTERCLTSCATTKWTRAGFFPTSKPKLRQNQFGGTFGGPVYIPKLYDGRNRTFFFSNYEGIRIRQEQFGRYTVPSDAQRGGDFSRTYTGAPYTGSGTGSSRSRTPFPGNIIPPNRIVQSGAEHPGLLSASEQARSEFQLRDLSPGNNRQQFDDSTVSITSSRKRTSFSRRGAYDNRARPDPEFFPGFVRNTGLKAYNIVLGHTRVWSPTVVQESRVAFNRSFIFQSDPRENTDFSIEKELGIPGIPAAGQTNGFPYFNIAGFAGYRRYDEQSADTAGPGVAVAE